MTAFALRLRPLAALAGALALLAACNNEQTAADGFKPVPVSPVLTEVPIGSATAPVTVVEYASFTCSHCRDFWKQDFPRIKSQYIDTGKVKFVYRDFPLDESLAVMLAAVSRCKGADAYHAIVDDIFTRQYDILDAAGKGAAGPIILEIAGKHGLSVDETRTCIDHTPALRTAILKSRDEGSSRGITSTPTVFVNDERVTDHTFANLSAAIEKKLNPGAAPATPAQPAAPTEGAPASAPAAPQPSAP